MTLETRLEIGLHSSSIPNNLYLISNLIFFYGFFIEQLFIEFILMLSPDIVKNIIVLFINICLIDSLFIEKDLSNLARHTRYIRHRFQPSHGGGPEFESQQAHFLYCPFFSDLEALYTSFSNASTFVSGSDFSSGCAPMQY